ncbi:phosphoenolpyruvate--protein phosphotransferase [Methylophilaceae bacterium]|nr:phosphoenolpyruvate--protein phosphotransferase [Methylophilaceae bacterium]
MHTFNVHGLAASSGIAIGKVQVVSNALLEVQHYKIKKADLDNEKNRLSQAIALVKKDLKNIKKDINQKSSSDFSSFIDIHLMMLEDKNFSFYPQEIIKSEQCNAEWAIKTQLDLVISKFDAIDDPYIKERKLDVTQVAERLIKILLGHQHKKNAQKNPFSTILVAHDISPADALQFKNHNYAAFITEHGGTNSHTAILARGLAIPSIVAVKNARKLIKNNDLVVVDGDSGLAIINPNDQILKEYEYKKNLWEVEYKKLLKIKNVKSTTLNNHVISLMANIEDLGDIKSVLESKAAGVGLFRTEFLFMNRDDLPGEEEQFETYKSIALSMKSKPVVIRTLDSGADKATAADTIQATNPALGLRAIRLCLSHPHFFLIQLKAILRASAFGNIKILIPMLSSLGELKQVKMLIKRAKDNLLSDAINFDKNIEVGGMIEIPAVAINAEAFARELDFLSIGTNDLIQYTLAIDRTDDSVSHLYNALHPAVLKLISNTINAGKKYGKEVAICGEMAGDPKLTKLLIGMGLTNFSMHPASILAVKKQILESDSSKLKNHAMKLLRLSDAEKIETLIQKINQ